jgi:AcrR family transcriptional regulator
MKMLPPPVNNYIAITMKDVVLPATRRTGRPLSFDRDMALKAAMHLFWEHGFEATSIADLTAAMGITPPSLYTAFGDKRSLFREAVDHYLGGVKPILHNIESAATAREAAHDLLTNAAIGGTGEDTPAGCLLASSIVSSSADAADLRNELAQIRRDIEAALRLRIERDIDEGLLPSRSDAEMLAGHVFAVVQGMSTLAKDGAGRQKLLRIVDGVTASWPIPPCPRQRLQA